LLIVTVGIVCSFSQSSYSQRQTIALEGPHETSIAWSPDSLQIAIGTDQGIFFVNAANGEITDRFTHEEFGEGSPQFILQIDWSPDGTTLAIVGKEEVTVHYPTDVWIIDRKDRTAKKVTNSVVGSIYYNSANWTPDGRTVLLGVETVDRIESKTTVGSASRYVSTICTLDPETEEINDFEGVLPAAKTLGLYEQAQSLLTPGNTYGFILKNLQK
ncbi:hypothetical protein L0152_32930, partial [bacterium]|nr:hypothetical protein [bacterium]